MGESLHDEKAPGGSIAMVSVPNLRDLGGWRVRGGGCVRRGQVFRSAALADADGAGVEALTALGVRTVFDLRTEAERVAQPDRVPPGADLVARDVFGDDMGTAFGLPAELQSALPAEMRGASPADLVGLLSRSGPVLEFLGGGRAARMLAKGYRGIATLPGACAAYGTLFADLAQAERRPALLHCTTGKDRAGWAAAALLLLLGVSDADVMADYLLTNEQLLPAMQPLFDRFTAAGGDPDVLHALLGARAEYLEAALDEMSSRFGTVGRYFEDGLGVDADRLSALRTALIDRAGAPA
ncbi:MAG: tyrosine-protein phosphatase [Thermoleophilia bacterium]|jgi:protein-tyrosine phosphatase|nr:tyrosine-protein phosphatase [Thermoleophilia bacterium]